MPFKFVNALAHSVILSGVMSIYASPTLVYAQPSPAALAEYPSAETERSPRGKKLTCPFASASVFGRTKLFFGSLRPNGSQVSDTEFQTFLNREITPRFPDGLTLLAGFGQFKNSQGVVIKERSRLLILLYPIEQAKNSSWRIEQIRKAYNRAFQQESVLRTDELSCVSF